MTKLAEMKVRTTRTKGDGAKSKCLQADTVNLFDPKENKHSTVKIKVILENTANPHFVRRNVLTKGAIIETEKGKARITSRPGQHGTMNATLI